MLLRLFRSRRIDVRSLWGFLSKREIRGLSSIFSAARKYDLGWIGQVILIGWKCSATLTVKLNYVPNKNFNFLSATKYSIYSLPQDDTFKIKSRLIKILYSFPFPCGHIQHNVKVNKNLYIYIYIYIFLDILIGIIVFITNNRFKEQISSEVVNDQITLMPFGKAWIYLSIYFVQWSDILTKYHTIQSILFYSYLPKW